jgi:hypothetical protein
MRPAGYHSMAMSAYPLKSCAIAFASLTLAWVGHAVDSVPSASPFLPPPAPAAASTAPAGAALEYRGTLDLGDGLQFRVVDVTHKTGVWLRLNERDSDFDYVVKQYNDSGDKDRITVEQGGRTFILAQHDAKVGSGGGRGQMPPPQPGMPQYMPPAITNTVVLNPSPADDTTRLNAVVQEVMRRRALREQAAQGQSGQPTPVQVQPQPGLQRLGR